MVENNKDPFPKVPSHTHNGVDSPQIDGRSFVGTPFPAITAQSGSLSTGGGAVLSTSDSDTIVNTINRVTEIEDLLRTLGIII
jgi:hypothetical protein